MLKLFKTAALSALIGLGALAAVPASAHANSGSVYLGFGSGHHGPSVGFHFGDRGHHYRPGRDHRPRHGQCSARQALNKAARMGVRNPRIVNANHRVVQVQGRQRGYGLTRVTFANQHHCPTIR